MSPRFFISNFTWCLTILVAVLLTLSGCKDKEHAHADTYTCPMHPTVISDKPGTCPVCGMDLVRKARPGEEVVVDKDLSKLLKSPNEIVIADVKTIKGRYELMPLTLEAQGMVTYDPRNIFTVSSRIGGRIEKAILKYPYQEVAPGQKVIEIYSPELLTAQRELIFLLENDNENKPLIDAARNRLTVLGVSESQIDKIVKSREVQNTLSVFSPYGGYVVEPGQQAPSAPTTIVAASGSAMGEGMENSANSQNNSTAGARQSNDGLIREGSYVTSGQALYKVIGTQSIRVEFNVRSADVGRIEIGTKVMLDFGDTHHHNATVDFIQPYFNQNEEYLTLRAYTNETEDLHIGHLVKALITSESQESLWIPKTAVVDLGLEKVVFLKVKEMLKPVKVTTGFSSGDFVQIKQGLSSTDEIAENAQYLVDSESFIKSK